MRVVQIEPGPMPTLTASAPCVDQRLRRRRRWRCCRRSPATCGIVLLDPAHAVEHALRMAVRGVDDDARRRRPRPAPRRAPRCPRPRRPRRRRAAARARPCRRSGCSVALRMSLTVIRPAQLEGVVDDEHALEPVLVHQRLAPRRASAPSGTVTSFSRGVMMSRTGWSRLRLEAQVAVGDDADHACSPSTTGKPEMRCCARAARAPRAPASSAGW